MKKTNNCFVKFANKLKFHDFFCLDFADPDIEVARNIELFKA